MSVSTKPRNRAVLCGSVGRGGYERFRQGGRPTSLGRCLWKGAGKEAVLSRTVKTRLGEGRRGWGPLCLMVARFLGAAVLSSVGREESPRGAVTSVALFLSELQFPGQLHGDRAEPTPEVILWASELKHAQV